MLIGLLLAGLAFGASAQSTDTAPVPIPEETAAVSGLELQIEPMSVVNDTDVTTREAEQWRFKAPSDVVGVLGPDLFGDSTDHENGSTGFKVVDIDLPGNSGLPVQLVRERQMGLSTGFASLVPMGNAGSLLKARWEVKVPVLSGIYAYSLDGNTNATGMGWNVDTSTPSARCSTGDGRPKFVGNAWSWGPFEYWGGVKLEVPGQVNDVLLTTLPGVPNRAVNPTRWTTKNRWLLDCLPTIVNGSGEGFLATAPNGDKYTFNRMVVKPAISRFAKMKVNIGTIIGIGQNTYERLNKGQYYLVATKVEDRFGNYVNYNYNASNQLTSMVANDGRTISLTYNANGLVSTAVAHGKTWTYAYTGDELTSVTLPDTRMWTYAVTGSFKMFVPDPEIPEPPGCGGSMDGSGAGSYTITHPSGAVGTFNFNMRDFYNPWVRSCPGMFENVATNVGSLVLKTIAAPGAAAQSWTYEYQTPGYLTQAGYPMDRDECLAGLCPTTRTTTVTGPDGTSTVFTFRLDDHPSGLGLVRSESVRSGSTVLKDSQNQYVAYDAVGQPFALKVGSNPFQNGLPGYVGLGSEGSVHEYIRPQTQSIAVQDGVTYTNQVNAFDSYARSIDVTRSNSNGTSKTELMQYSDDTTQWVLGQLTSVADVASGQIEQAITYHPTTRLIATRSKFGQLVGSLTWNANGTLATAKDGKNNTTSLSNYKAGNPQRVDFADATYETGVFNDFGWLTSMTNARGYSSSFAYDNIGRLTGVTPPTGDTVAWAGTTLTFTPLTTAIYGVPVGGWRHTISRGNYRKETYMDALYRPLVIREYDNANVAGTERFTVKAYDTSNREVFSSYLGKTSGLTVGVRTEYDALGRVTKTKADSEMGLLTTTTEYLTGGGIKVTGPDGNVTTRTFRSLDAPSYDQMISEAAPGGVTTSISRDVFGKPLTITRSGSDGLNISKQFAYDSAQRLCMRTEPETGTSIIDYDAAGNVLWAANGQTVANANVCNRAAAVAGAKINYSYDTLNRVTGTDVPSSTNDPTVTYLPDGTVNTLSNGTATWTYTYNKLGKPVTESLNLGGKVSTITHAYDTLANEASLTYPSGTNIAYLPNALGQASKAGTYTTGMTYRASGFLTAMTYGNGATYSAQPNLRGLPARRLDKKGTTVITDELMAYDQDANPVCVRDTTTGNPGHRDFTYDARDRLIKVSAPNQGWISSEYQYDSQDNIKMARLGTRQYNYTQNALNQLVSITQPATAPGAANYVLGTCADASMTADLSSSYTGPTVAIPGAGMPGTATTGGTQTAKYTFTTDNEGRMTQKGTQSYVYDALNRMTQVTTKESYLYDGHGRRVQVTKTSDGKINYPLYGLDGKLLVEDNRQTLTSTEYIFAGGRLVAKIIQPITAAGANNGTATTTTIHTDFLGSPVAETNSAGTVTRVERYTPYGEPSDMALDAGPGFTGHATDVATGLTYMQQRYYDAEIGRFISPDPVGPEEDFIKHFNRYNYAQNNPIRYTDPDGRSALTLAIKFVLKGGDAAATFAGVVDDANTVMDSNASGGSRLIAAASILSEVVSPVSLRDGKAVVKMTEGAGDAAQAGKRGTCPSCGASTSKSEAAIANDHGKSKSDVKAVIHQAKNDGPNSGDIGKTNGDVEVCRDCGEIHPQTPNNGLGDSIGNINDPIERKK